jgi:hypothetical protein
MIYRKIIFIADILMSIIGIALLLLLVPIRSYDEYRTFQFVFWFLGALFFHFFMIPTMYFLGYTKSKKVKKI